MSRIRIEDPKQLTVRKISNLFEIPERTLQYWIETGLIKPVLHTGRRGSMIILSYWNLLETAVILELRSKGCSLQGVRKAVEYIQRNLDSKIYDRRLIVTEKDILDYGSLSKINDKEKTRIISLVEQQGQMFFINLKQLRRKINKELKEEKIGFSLN
jgi:DNA-binding transcriptional MerR regulator